MANLVGSRDIEQALIALKKGAHLLKYGRKGKPKLYPFRLSNDETTLIWLSTSGEKGLKLALISRVIPGQRTAVFQRNLCPEKDYLSFSLIYNNGKRSLDLICKDKAEAEVWIAGLQEIISSRQGGRSKIDGWSDGCFYLDDGQELTSNSPSDSSVRSNRNFSYSEVSSSFDSMSSPLTLKPENPALLDRSPVGSESAKMQRRGSSSSEIFRFSVSSAPSTSSHGSSRDDYDALGDVYIWGEVISDNYVKVGANKNANYIRTQRTDVLLPMLLESNAVLDVHQIACGVRHAALVTRQGEIFTWGEESGGRLGHGIRKNVSRPHLVELLASTNIDFVACGEFHTCAVTMTGELYTWGDGTHNAGLLGHGTNVSHWIPKRISGPLEGLQVASVTCGPWHTALITATGQLFTFGDGTFGVLGHGDRETILSPREVESLTGLRTIAVACGVWHTAAVVEVIATQSSSSFSTGKLFTWGDGDKNRLGHGDKDSRLKPTCVPALIDYNFHKVACGHSLTVGLTTSGRIFTMGSTVYGQLGNPQDDGKLPCLVEDKLTSESVEELSCGAYHVAVLTSKNEVYTWGKGANGRLGHGDAEDRKTPTLVASLKDRHVKYIACGSNYTAVICLHKWVSSADQSQCSACRQTFGFTRKRHNCYNCGLVHCHSCSSKKAINAAMAPNPAKPYRVCDTCFAKLSKVSDGGTNSHRRNAIPRHSGENKDRLDKIELRLANLAIPHSIELIKQLDSKSRYGKKTEMFSLVCTSQTSSMLQLKDVVLSSAADLRRMVPKPVPSRSAVSSRSVSPFSKRASPLRSATPFPTTSGLSFSKNMSDSLKKSNGLLNQEVTRLRSQVESLRHRCDMRELELQRSAKKLQEAKELAIEESTKSKAAKEVIKSLTAQLKDIAERLPPGAYDNDSMRPAYLRNGLEENGTYLSDSNGQPSSRSESISSSFVASAKTSSATGLRSPTRFPNDKGGDGRDDPCERLTSGGSVVEANNSLPEAIDENESIPGQVSAKGSRYRNSVAATFATVATHSDQVEAEWIEQYEPGVYITLVALGDGTIKVERIRFSRRKFKEQEAETWWSENSHKMYDKYNRRSSDK